MLEGVSGREAEEPLLTLGGRWRGGRIWLLDFTVVMVMCRHGDSKVSRNKVILEEPPYPYPLISDCHTFAHLLVFVTTFHGHYPLRASIHPHLLIHCRVVGAAVSAGSGKRPSSRQPLPAYST